MYVKKNTVILLKKEFLDWTVKLNVLISDKYSFGVGTYTVKQLSKFLNAFL